MPNVVLVLFPYTDPCRDPKKKPGMIERAIREYELDPEECILFGDQPWDVEAGKRAGVRSILCLQAGV